MTLHARDNWPFAIGVLAALALLAAFIIAIHLLANLCPQPLPPAAVRSLVSPACQKRLTAYVVEESKSNGADARPAAGGSYFP